MPPIRPGFLFACDSCKKSKPASCYRLRKCGRPTTCCKDCVREREKLAMRRHRKGIKIRTKDDPNSDQFKCGRCQQMLPKERFYKNAARYRGYDGYCKDCSKKSHLVNYLKFKFDLSPEDYERMLREQNEVCFICKKPETVVHLGKIPRLSVDHCHNTNKVRGLLCYSCNHLIGFLERHGEVQVEKAWEYIAKHS